MGFKATTLGTWQSVNGNITYHKMDIKSNNISNKSRTIEQLLAYKDRGKQNRYHRLTKFGEALPIFPTSLLTQREIIENKKGGVYSEARSKKKTYKRRIRMSCDPNVEFLEAAFRKYLEMGYDEKEAKSKALLEFEEKGLW